MINSDLKKNMIIPMTAMVAMVAILTVLTSKTSVALVAMVALVRANAVDFHFALTFRAATDYVEQPEWLAWSWSWRGRGVVVAARGPLCPPGGAWYGRQLEAALGW